MAQSNEAIYRKILRDDLAAFCMRAIAEVEPSLTLQWNWHHDLLVARLVALHRGEILRLLVCVPPRSLKSLICSVAFPAWILGRDASQTVVCVSYAQPLAEGFARQSRSVMESPFYEATFPTRIKRDRRAVDDFWTTGGGRRVATSVGGTFTGRGGDYIIIDDPMKPEEALSEAGRRSVIDWLRNTLMSRLNSKKTGRMMVVMQRLHEEDLAAVLIDHGGWELLSLPAIAQVDEVHRYRTMMGWQTVRRLTGEALHPERESVLTLGRIRADMGDLAFVAQYLQAPASPLGNIVKRAWFKTYDFDKLGDLDGILQSWDTAQSTSHGADYSVGTTWGVIDDDFFLLDVVRERADFPTLKEMVLAANEKWKPSKILIEDAGSGKSLAQYLLADGLYIVEAITADRDKLSRFMGASLMIEAGRVYLPAEAPWRDVFLAEICAFPAGGHDDQVDSLSQAINNMRDHPVLPGLFRYYRNEKRKRDGKPPHILLNYVDLGKQFDLVTGRRAARESDGSFLVTDEEYQPLAKLDGLSRVYV